MTDRGQGDSGDARPIGPADSTLTPESTGGAPAEPTLDRLVAEQGPMPEATVRGMGARLAEALAAMHALRQVFGDLRPETVLIYPDGPRLGGARPAPATAGPGDDVTSLAALLVFAATGRAPRDGGLEALPAGLRTVLSDYLSGAASGRPGAATELARALAEPVQPTRTPDPATAPVPADPSTVVVSSQSPPAQRDSSSRLPWILAGACALLIVVILATVGIILATRSDDSKTSADGTSPGGTAEPAVKYTAASLGDACALLDFPAMEKYIGKPYQNPQGSKIEMPTVADSLECMPLTDNGFVLLHIEVSDQPAMVHSLYDGHRADGLGTTGSGVTTGKVSGIGEDAYQVIHEPNKGNSQQIGCSLGFLNANAAVIVDINVGEDNGTGRDKLAEICQAQARTVLGRMK